LYAGIKLLLKLQEVMVQPCYAILKNATLVQVQLQTSAMPSCLPYTLFSPYHKHRYLHIVLLLLSAIDIT
jgi:hypothetical protein